MNNKDIMFDMFNKVGFIFYVIFTDKERELADAQSKIRALKYSERLREKAVEEVMLMAWPAYFFLKIYGNVLLVWVNMLGTQYRYGD